MSAESRNYDEKVAPSPPGSPLYADTAFVDPPEQETLVCGVIIGSGSAN
jgi:hypothetical protein